MSDTAEVPDSTPVVGELVELTGVEPSAEQRSADARGRIGNTAVQAGVPGAVITIGTWAAALARIDLDPGPGSDMPAVVAGAFVTTLTVAMAWLMNRRNLTGG